ncbi:hypothetical protein KOW79_001252 [Hemibagrus wyckioides]|uniref:Uncharacterized protein n=1 Tax=Hemibagrus wyckioides TaxID=337641 RepID=A0A9D3SRH4_9TELE|nr:hypothetical protein KOW79_001252 [Hemibagrus wyckioides]
MDPSQSTSNDSLQNTSPPLDPVECVHFQVVVAHQGAIIRTYQEQLTALQTANKQLQQAPQNRSTIRESDSTSSRSNSITITVVNLQQPKISFSAADGWSHYGPEGPEMIRGYGFSIICSTEPQYPGGSFHLGFSGSNITRTQSAVNHSAIFLFPEADFNHQGNYSCTYEVSVSSRTFTSTTNEHVLISMKVPLAPFIGFGVTAGLLLTFLPIIIWVVMTWKRRKCQIDKKDTQYAEKTSEHPQVENKSDVQPYYEFAEVIVQQKKSGLRVK